MLYCLRNDFKEKVCICLLERHIVFGFGVFFVVFFGFFLVLVFLMFLIPGWLDLDGGPVEAKCWLSHS